MSIRNSPLSSAVTTYVAKAMKTKQNRLKLLWEKLMVPSKFSQFYCKYFIYTYEQRRTKHLTQDPDKHEKPITSTREVCTQLTCQIKHRSLSTSLLTGGFLKVQKDFNFNTNLQTQNFEFDKVSKFLTPDTQSTMKYSKLFLLYPFLFAGEFITKGKVTHMIFTSILFQLQVNSVVLSPTNAILFGPAFLDVVLKPGKNCFSEYYSSWTLPMLHRHLCMTFDNCESYRRIEIKVVYTSYFRFKILLLLQMTFSTVI